MILDRDEATYSTKKAKPWVNKTTCWLGKHTGHSSSESCMDIGELRRMMWSMPDAGDDLAGAFCSSCFEPYVVRGVSGLPDTFLFKQTTTSKVSFFRRAISGVHVCLHLKHRTVVVPSIPFLGKRFIRKQDGHFIRHISGLGRVDVIFQRQGKSPYHRLESACSNKL